MTLAEFLLARIAEDEARTPTHYMPFEREWDWCAQARMEPLGDLDWGPGAVCDCKYEARRWRHTAELDAKRRLIELHDDRDVHECVPTMQVWPDLDTPKPVPCPTLRASALPYADHPDYRDEWRP